MTDIVDRLRAGEPCSEAGDRCKVMNGPSGCLCAIAADEIARLNTALAASEAKLKKAREALRPFADDLVRRPWIASHLTWDVDKSSLTNRDIHRAATTLKDITQ